MNTQIIRRNNGFNSLTPFDQLFENFFREPAFTRALAPNFEQDVLAVDLSEDDDNLIIRASLPGMRKEDVNVEVHDSMVTISAHREDVQEDKQEKFYRRERRSGSVSRRIALPVAVLEDQADAELKDGELTLRLPKSTQGGPRKVSIK